MTSPNFMIYARFELSNLRRIFVSGPTCGWIPDTCRNAIPSVNVLGNSSHCCHQITNLPILYWKKTMQNLDTWSWRLGHTTTRNFQSLAFITMIEWCDHGSLELLCHHTDCTHLRKIRNQINTVPFGNSKAEYRYVEPILLGRVLRTFSIAAEGGNSPKFILELGNPLL